MNKLSVADLAVTMEIEVIKNRPDGLFQSDNYDHFVLRLQRIQFGVGRDFFFSVSKSNPINMTIDNVLDCLTFYWQLTQNGYVEFCNQLGYETDSHLSAKYYQYSLKTGEKLGYLFPDYNLDQIFAIFQRD